MEERCVIRLPPPQGSRERIIAEHLFPRPQLLPREREDRSDHAIDATRDHVRSAGSNMPGPADDVDRFLGGVLHEAEVATHLIENGEAPGPIGP